MGSNCKAAFAAMQEYSSFELIDEARMTRKQTIEYIHQQSMLYCNMQGELLIRLVSGLQVNSGGLLQNLGDIGNLGDKKQQI